MKGIKKIDSFLGLEALIILHWSTILLWFCNIISLCINKFRKWKPPQRVCRLLILYSYSSTLGLGWWFLLLGIKCYSCSRNLLLGKEVVSQVYATTYVSSKWKHIFFFKKGWGVGGKPHLTGQVMIFWGSVALGTQMLGSVRSCLKLDTT